MVRVLRKDVFVDDVRYSAGTADSDIPSEVLDRITNPIAWLDFDEIVAENESGPPPRSGPGSSREKWAEYALSRFKEYDLDAELFGENPTKAQIIEVLTVAGVPTK